MKQVLLLGIITFSLFFFSSCNNALEGSEGIGTGRLNITLEADAFVNVTTKAISSIPFEGDIDEFNIMGTKGGSKISLGTCAELNDGKEVQAGIYEIITASYGEMESDLAFDCPIFSGSTMEVVRVYPDPNRPTSVPITAKLANSIITVDEEAFYNLKGVTITDLYVHTTSDNKKYELLSTDGGLYTDELLFVKSGLTNVSITIKGYLTEDPTKTIEHTSLIKDKEGNSMITAAKNYNVKYSIVPSEKGGLKLFIEVNGAVEEIELEVPVNPYE